MKEYNHKKIETKWQDLWEKKGFFKAIDNSKKEKFYCLIEFPYPSGEGLHVGHPRSYTGLDTLARMKRMQGFNVLYPIGWDAFGLPAENYAIKTGTHPKETTKKNIATFKRQLKSFGYSFDWSREIDTTDPKYYKWTQWIFLQLFKKGLAYKDEIPINFCTDCKVGLANEEVVNGVCERCGGEVIKKVKKQWMLKITEYADKLLEDLKDLDYQNRIKIQQENWIGRSEGADVIFKVKDSKEEMVVFTTRPDTLFGATFMVLAPEHELVHKLESQIENIDEVKKYVNTAVNKSDLERTDLAKEKTGIELKGIKAINPVNNQEIPIWIADYVLISYGTGSIMAVPGHDQRDWDFAKKYNLEIIEVIKGGDVTKEAFEDIKDGTMVNSEQFDGQSAKDAIKNITKWLEEKKYGKFAVNYKLRDWVFSRQRYWGEPIPIIECKKCGFVPLDEKDLPLELPEVEKFQTADTGESPLATITDWVNVKCPKCKGDAKRETDTMPQWAGSSWYFLRYIDPNNNKALADKKLLKYWAPVDWYNGGMEHTTLHLLYSRFWNKFLFDIGAIPNSEPYAKRTSHGLILGKGGEKMSKSRGNVINPDDIVEEFGADTFRVYEMFMGPFDQPIPWDTKGVIGVRRFLEKVWKMQEIVSDKAIKVDKAIERLIHQTIKKVGDDILTQDYNTAVSSLMILVNKLNQQEEISKNDFEVLLIILSPLAPHICEELWKELGNKKSITQSNWPKFEEKKAVEEEFELVISVNGKVRDKIKVASNISQKEAEKISKENEKVKKYFKDKEIQKVIFVPKKLINFVIK